MTYLIHVPNGIITMCETAFVCPKCGTRYGGEKESERLYKSKNMWIYKRCTSCRSWIGITTDIKGDVRVWLKENELARNGNELLRVAKSVIK